MINANDMCMHRVLRMGKTHIYICLGRCGKWGQERRLVEGLPGRRDTLEKVSVIRKGKAWEAASSTCDHLEEL